MKIIVSLLLLGFSLSAFVQSSPTQKVTNLQKKAIKTLFQAENRNKNLKAANLILDSAIKIDPKNISTYSLKLQNLISLKEYTRAIRVADSALNVRPVLEILTGKAALLEKTGNAAEAKQSYRKALAVGQATYAKQPSSTLLCNLTVVHRLLYGNQQATDFLNKEKTKFKKDVKGMKQIEAFEKTLPSFTTDIILGIRPPVIPPSGARKTIS